MAGNKNSGRKAKSLEDHLLEGTYRPSVHAKLLDAPALVLPPKPKLTVSASRADQSRWIRSEADEHAFSTGCRFNEPLAEHICQFFRKFLKHSSERWSGKPFEPTEWQITQLLYPLFGWVREDGTRRYRRTYIEMPKKNGKSALASGIGLYGMLESPGVHVYSFGGNKDQAKVVHDEAIRMGEASEVLNANFKINRTTGVIAFHQGKSTYSARAASDKLAGIKIHFAICDELHEWDGRGQWEDIILGGRASSQPLFFVITNAGDNKDTVCFEQREKAERVISGKTKDPSFFPLVCAVTEEEARKELDAISLGDHSLPVAKRVNPGMGLIINEQDFVRDCMDAIEAPTGIPNLLRLSYGVWVSAGETLLLPTGRWAQLAADFDEQDLLGRSCTAGIDLGFTHDLTALSLWFPPLYDGEKAKVLCWYWLPERVADNPRSRMRGDFLRWAKDPKARLELTPGQVTDHGYLQSRFRELFSLFDVQALLYDNRGAEKTTQELSDGLIGPGGKVLLEGTGVTRVEFAQGIKNYAEPTLEFERLVVGGGVEHDGNPLLAWQMEHCSFRELDGLKMPCKPGDRRSNSHDYRTVDGVQATIMALAGSRAMPDSIHTACGLHVFGSGTEPTRKRTEWFDDDE